MTVNDQDILYGTTTKKRRHTHPGRTRTDNNDFAWLFIKLPFALRYNITIDIEIFYIQRDNLSDTP